MRAFDNLPSLLAALGRPSALAEALIVACLLALAWVSIRVTAGRSRGRGSIWVGDNVIDGVLFPLIALVLVECSRWAWRSGWGPGTPALLTLTVPVLASLLLIRVTVRVLHMAFPTSATVRLVERTLSWLVWGGLVLWLTGLWTPLLAELDDLTWKVGASKVSLRNLLEGLLSAAVVLVGVLWLSAAVESRLLRDAGVGGENLSLRKIAANAVRALLLSVGVLLAFSAAGVDLTALSVVGGAFGVGLGFGLQKLAANYVSGFVILAERSLRIGDMVKVDNFEGRVTDIKTRYTVIRALNGRESIVPNELLITQRVENASLADAKVLMTATVQVEYAAKLESLLPTLGKAVAQVPRVLTEPAPSALLAGFGADGFDLQVNFWIADPENGQANVRSDVNLALLRCLHEAGVAIPYPHRVVRQLA